MESLVLLFNEEVKLSVLCLNFSFSCVSVTNSLIETERCLSAAGETSSYSDFAKEGTGVGLPGQSSRCCGSLQWVN